MIDSIERIQPPDPEWIVNMLTAGVADLIARGQTLGGFDVKVVGIKQDSVYIRATRPLPKAKARGGDLSCDEPTFDFVVRIDSQTT